MTTLLQFTLFYSINRYYLKYCFRCKNDKMLQFYIKNTILNILNNNTLNSWFVLRYYIDRVNWTWCPGTWGLEHPRFTVLWQKALLLCTQNSPTPVPPPSSYPLYTVKISCLNLPRHLSKLAEHKETATASLAAKLPLRWTLRRQFTSHLSKFSKGSRNLDSIILFSSKYNHTKGIQIPLLFLNCLRECHIFLEKLYCTHSLHGRAAVVVV